MAVQKKKVVPLKVKSVSEKRSPKTVAELKRKYKDLPLYFLFGIREEVDYQCPILDEYLKEIQAAVESLKKIRKCKNLEAAQVEAAKVLYALSDVSEGIDEVTRANFEKLRASGEDWKQLAIFAMNETKTPEKFLKI